MKKRVKRNSRLTTSRFSKAGLLIFVTVFAAAGAYFIYKSFAATATINDVVVASGLSSPTAMEVAPDGRIFVAQQGGALRVIKNGTLLATPFLSVPVDASGERGLLGVTFDPNFSSNGFVYIYYTNSNPVTNRVARYTASTSNPDVSAAGSGVTIFDNIPSASGYHNGGALHFGKDNRLYIAVGEGHTPSNSQSISNLAGKILRINADGSIPTDNPFYTQTSGSSRAIWALGLRNPFTFDIQPGTGRLFINDVGAGSWEEINDGCTPPTCGGGYNFGWPATEGATTNPSYKTPFHYYGRELGACAITGGAFYNPTTVNFPTEYVGDYFFADYCANWIKVIDLNTKAVSNFISNISAPVDIKVDRQGSLYYLARGQGAVHRVFYTYQDPPSITAQPANASVSVGGTATFTVSASGTAPLSYQWQKNGANIAGANSASYTLSNAQASDNGAQFRAVVTNSLGSATSNAATLTVATNQPPVASITAPAAGTLYSGAEVFNYTGTGNDTQDGSLPASAFTWRVDFHHDDHTHPHVQAVTGSKTGSFSIPTVGETSSNVWYRIHLTVRDSGGLTHSVSRDIQPRKITVTLNSNISGLQLTLDGQPVASPHTFTGVVGITRAIGAPSPQSASGRSYQYQSWSDGGSQTHNISTPSANTTYTASFAVSVPPHIAAADLNNDTRVNILDLSILLSNYNSSNPAADINGDGQVNITDLSILLSRYGS